MQLARFDAGHPLGNIKKQNNLMTGHSILYLGRGDFASEYLAELETLPCCSMLARSAGFNVPVDDRGLLDIVLLEASPLIAQSGRSLSELIQSLHDYPVVAITRKEHEHRGIAALRAGAQGYICIDDVTVEAQEAVFEHAVRRHRLQQRLSDTDVSVLSVLNSINDGVRAGNRRSVAATNRATTTGIRRTCPWSAPAAA